MAKTLHGHHTRAFTSKIYRTWGDMNSRCNNPKVTGYKWYGGKGIKVCERWKDFKCFLADMGEKPAGMTLDRIDSNKDYGPENCRWATWSQQAANKAPRGKSKYRGVYFKKYRWNTQVRISGRTIHVGNFDTEKKAAIAYDDFVVKNNLERKLNIVDSEDRCPITA